MTKTLAVAGLAGTLAILAALLPVSAPAMETSEANVTVIYKTNPYWPVRGMMSVEPCDLRKCLEI